MNTAFEIMLYGMAGIFAAILIIMTITYFLKVADSKTESVQQKNPRKP